MVLPDCASSVELHISSMKRISAHSSFLFHPPSEKWKTVWGTDAIAWLFPCFCTSLNKYYNTCLYADLNAFRRWWCWFSGKRKVQRTKPRPGNSGMVDNTALNNEYLTQVPTSFTLVYSYSSCSVNILRRLARCNPIWALYCFRQGAQHCESVAQ